MIQFLFLFFLSFIIGCGTVIGNGNKPDDTDKTENETAASQGNAQESFENDIPNPVDGTSPGNVDFLWNVCASPMTTLADGVYDLVLRNRSGELFDDQYTLSRSGLDLSIELQSEEYARYGNLNKYEMTQASTTVYERISSCESIVTDPQNYEIEGGDFERKVVELNDLNGSSHYLEWFEDENGQVRYLNLYDASLNLAFEAEITAQP